MVAASGSSYTRGTERMRAAPPRGGLALRRPSRFRRLTDQIPARYRQATNYEWRTSMPSHFVEYSNLIISPKADENVGKEQCMHSETKFTFNTKRCGPSGANLIPMDSGRGQGQSRY